jgi:hypothetical protein
MWLVFSLEEVSCIAIIASRSQAVLWILCKSKVQSRTQNTLSLFCIVTKMNLIFPFPSLFKILFNVILPSKHSLYFFLLPSDFLIDILHGRHVWCDPSVSLTNFTDVFLPLLTTYTRFGVGKILKLLFT